MTKAWAFDNMSATTDVTRARVAACCIVVAPNHKPARPSKSGQTAGSATETSMGKIARLHLGYFAQFKRSKYMKIYGILRESNLSFHPNRKTKAAEPLSKKGEPVEGIQGLSIPNCHGRHAEDIEDHHGVRFLAPAGPVFGQPAVLTNFASWFFYLPTIQRTSLELFFETNGRNNME